MNERSTAFLWLGRAQLVRLQPLPLDILTKIQSHGWRPRPWHCLRKSIAKVEHGVSKLAIFDVDREMLKSALEHLGATSSVGQVVMARAVDVTNEESINDEVNLIAADIGGIDILLCFAGITESKLSVEYSIESWKKIFDVNLHGTFLVARAVARYTSHLLTYNGWR